MVVTRPQDKVAECLVALGRMLRHVLLSVMLLVCLFFSLAPGLAWSLDTKVMQAQQKLSVLGYDPGAVDGVLGPRTRQALQAFQQDHDLPSTGTLDVQTLEALGFTIPITLFEHVPLQPPPAAPWRVVLTYLRYYDTQPARLLPVVTERFREGLTPQQWLQQTADTLAAQAFSRLSWQIERVEMEEEREATHATVYVQSRVRIAGQEMTRQEVFSLLHSGETEWLIDAWRSGPLPAEPAVAHTHS